MPAMAVQLALFSYSSRGIVQHRRMCGACGGFQVCWACCVSLRLVAILSRRKGLPGEVLGVGLRALVAGALASILPSGIHSRRGQQMPIHPRCSSMSS